jgi:hypothetical protein
MFNSGKRRIDNKNRDKLQPHSTSSDGKRKCNNIHAEQQQQQQKTDSRGAELDPVSLSSLESSSRTSFEPVRCDCVLDRMNMSSNVRSTHSSAIIFSVLKLQNVCLEKITK